MDLSYLKKLVRIVENSSVDEIEVEEEYIRLLYTSGLYISKTVKWIIFFSETAVILMRTIYMTVWLEVTIVE